MESSYFSPAWLPICLGPETSEEPSGGIVLPLDSDLFKLQPCLNPYVVPGKSSYYCPLVLAIVKDDAVCG